MVLNENETIDDINSDTQIIAVIMPNKNGVRKAKWYDYTASVDNIEERTGYDFLNKLPMETQEIIEAKVFDYEK